MGVVFTEGVVRLAVEDIDPGAISGDGAGAFAVRCDLCPGAEVPAGQGDGEGVGEGRGRFEWGRDLLAVEYITRGGPDAVHGALAVEGDAVVVVGLRAFIEPGPGEALDAGLAVIDFGLDVGSAIGLLLSGF